MYRLKGRKILRTATVVLSLAFLFSCSQEKPRTPSATDNVKVIEQAFTIAGLDRQRTIRLYLPPGYDTSEARYPVLYMHDGQNLFDDVTSYVGEWGVDESLNRLSRDKGLNLIVVGIDNGQEKRMSELSPWPNKHVEAAEGEAYVNFIVNQVKPYIDTHYRTLPETESTAIMGSSMGGLISHYAIFKHPDVFSKAGIFSPSFWISDQVTPFSRVEDLAENSRLYYLVGGQEGADVVARVEELVTHLKDQGLVADRMKSKVVPHGEHNEGFWREEFVAAVLWLFEVQ
jgi:predicted alpha/beta superfamily hydrolase